MKQIISILFVIALGIASVSCSEQDKPSDKLAGTYWTYQKPHFEFEYSSDTIVLQMMKKQIKIGVNQLKGMYMAIAHEKMNAYFKGIDFKDNQSLAVDIQNKQQQSFRLPAQYVCDKNYLQLTLDMQNMASGTDLPMSNIPPVSFRYYIQNNQLTMYFEKVYIQTIYSIMGDSIAAMIIKAMGIDFSHAPEGMEEIAKQSIKKQLDEILQQTQRIEIGFVMNLK